MDIHQARALAAAHVREGEHRDGFTAMIVDEDTVTLPWGWVFFYNSREYLETGDDLYTIAGNAPIAVTRGGEIHETGTARPLEEYLREIGLRCEAHE